MLTLSPGKSYCLMENLNSLWTICIGTDFSFYAHSLIHIFYSIDHFWLNDAIRCRTCQKYIHTLTFLQRFCHQFCMNVWDFVFGFPLLVRETWPEWIWNIKILFRRDSNLFFVYYCPTCIRRLISLCITDEWVFWIISSVS